MIINVYSSLDIAAEHESVLSVIALANGWSPEALYGDGENAATITALEFVQEYILRPRMKGFFSALAGDSIRAWAGLSGSAQAQLVEGLVKEKLTVTVTVE